MKYTVYTHGFILIDVILTQKSLKCMLVRVSLLCTLGSSINNDYLVAKCSLAVRRHPKEQHIAQSHRYMKAFTLL
jgi:hypothetical protein